MRRILLWGMFTTFTLVSFGCGDKPADTTIGTGLFEYRDGRAFLELQTAEVISIEPLFDENGELEGGTFEITGPSGDRFGFTNRGEYFHEWSVRDGDRVELSGELLADGNIEWRLGDAVLKTFQGEEIDLRQEMALRTGRLPQTLHIWDNALGDKLVQSLSDPASSDDPVIKALVGPINDNGTCTQTFFNAAVLCAQAKCPFFGVANPVCHACTGVIIACIVAFVAAALGGM